MKKKFNIRTAVLLCMAVMALTGCGGGTETPENIGKMDEESAKEEQAAQKAEDVSADATDVSKAGEESRSDSVDARNPKNVDGEGVETNQALYEARIRHQYGGILSQIIAAWQLPDGELDTSSLNDGFGKMADNHFAVTDIDGDGREELIVRYTNACLAGMMEIIYDYDPASGALKRELTVWPSLTYYNNGIIKVEASHNDSRGEFWPYALYQYQANTDAYLQIGEVSSWDKELVAEWNDGQPFPDKLDTDGDGTLFCIKKEGEGEFYRRDYEDFKYDQADVDEWFGGYIAGAPTNAKEISIDYQPLEYESFADFTPAYLRMIAENANRERTDTDADLGLLILRDDEEHYLNMAKKLLTEQYGVTIEQPEENYEEYTVGLLDGNERFSFTMLDTGDLCYLGEKVEDVTIFGIYPGISVDGAWEKLQSYGFYASPYGEIENCLITGEGFGNIEIWFDAEDGKVTTITVRPFCAFAG